MNEQHKATIIEALEAYRKYINATHLTFDMGRHEKVKAIDAALEALDALDTPQVTDSNLREALAEQEHERWSGWMQYMFGKGHYRTMLTDEDNPLEVQQWLMPSWAVDRWTRQMNTPYADLTEAEKDSDRTEADKTLALLQQHNTPQMPQADWANAPQRATWWAVNPNGDQVWGEGKPACPRGRWIGIDDKGLSFGFYALVDARLPKIELPIGLDWRLSLQRRPAQEE